MSSHVAAGRKETRSTCPYCGCALARDPLCGVRGHPPLASPHACGSRSVLSESEQSLSEPQASLPPPGGGLCGVAP
jgi:hypothetical protein